MPEEEKREESKEDEEEKKLRLASLLNELLGLDIGWEKLSLEELVKIAELFVDPDKLLERLQKARQQAKDIIQGIKALVKDTLRAFIKNWQGPIIRAIREIVLELSLIHI